LKGGFARTELRVNGNDWWRFEICGSAQHENPPRSFADLMF
jgi:hypothetical protein